MELLISDILEFHRMSVEEIHKKLLREPSVCQMLTTEYKPVVNISDDVQFSVHLNALPEHLCVVDATGAPSRRQQ